MKEKSNSKGIASLICGILGLIGFPLPFFAVILSILAIVFAVQQRKQNPTGLSTAGLVLGILGIIINGIILLFFGVSAFGFMLSYQTNQQSEKLDEYNGYEFKKTSQGFMTEINNEKIYFSYYPGDLEEINISDDAKAILSETEAMFITYDPDSDFAEAIAEIEFDMEQKTQKTGIIHIARGLTNATDYALPEITCNNATADMPVLYIKRGKTSEITTSNNCITLTAETESILNTFYAKVLYIIFGVMK